MDILCQKFSIFDKYELFRIYHLDFRLLKIYRPERSYFKDEGFFNKNFERDFYSKFIYITWIACLKDGPKCILRV